MMCVRYRALPLNLPSGSEVYTNDRLYWLYSRRWLKSKKSDIPESHAKKEFQAPRPTVGAIYQAMY